MAKIGNEATLILKLAKERMEKELAFKEKIAESTDFLNGYRQGFTHYRDILAEISLELERK